MVCKSLHERRTKPLFNTVVKRIRAEGNDAFLLSGFDSFDEVDVINVSRTDDYLSCIQKLKSVFIRDWSEDYDWYFFADDDTFIHTPNLKNFLAAKSTTDRVIYSGCENNLFGGSGMILNRETYKSLSKFIRRGHWRDHNIHSDQSLLLTIKRFNIDNRENKIKFAWSNDMRCWSNMKGFDFDSGVISVHFKCLQPFLKSCTKPYEEFESRYFGDSSV